MSKRNQKPYWEMTTQELAEATAEFDEEFVADKFRPLTRKERAHWEEVQARLNAPKEQNGMLVIPVRLPKELLDRCTALARKKRISRDQLIARGLLAVLVAEGETG